MVLEKAACDLQHYICNGDISKGTRKPYSVSYKVQLALQVLQGLKYLHAIRILHRDLKPGNCLIYERAKMSSHRQKAATSECIVKLTDFGLL